MLGLLILSLVSIAYWVYHSRGDKPTRATIIGGTGASVLVGWIFWFVAILPPVSADSIPPADAPHVQHLVPPAAEARVPETGEPSPDVGDPRNKLAAAEVVLTGDWSNQDRVLVQAALTAALARVPGARGKSVTIDGVGRPLPPTSHRVPRYAITASWHLSSGLGEEVLLRDALPEVAGWGSTPDEARRDAALRAGKAVSAAVLRAFP